MIGIALGVAGVAAAGSVRLLRSPWAGGREGASAQARGGAHVATGGFGVLVGLLLAASFSDQLGATEVQVTLLALGAGMAGALIERRTLPAWAGLPVVLLAGVALAALGIRSTAVGLGVADAVLTMAWVVVVTAAVQRLDDARGAAAPVCAAIAAGFAVLAAGGGQDELVLVVGGLAAALAGVGIAGRAAPRVRLGRSGAAATGVVLSSATFLLEPATEAPVGSAIPVVLLALPLLLLAVVVAGRLRHGVPLRGRRGDDVVARLRRCGIRSHRALLLLLGAQVLVAGAVVAADRGLVALGSGLGGAVALCLLVAGVAGSFRVHPRAEGRPVGWSVALGGLGAAAVVLVIAGAFVALALARVDTGTAAVERGLGAARAGEFDDAAVAFLDAQAELGQAGRHLANPTVSAARLVPILGPNLAAARSLVALSGDVAAAGAGAATAAPARFDVRNGVVPVADIRASAPALAQAAATLRGAETTLAGIDPTHLVSPLRSAMDDLEGRLVRASADAGTAAAAAEAVPAIFGADGPRRYFLAVQNNAELRATGGFIGSFGEVVAEDGRLRLERFDRISVLNEAGDEVRPVDASAEFLQRYERFDVSTTWQSINLSPDFPTVGRIIAGAYPASGGQPVDGVIAIDPVGLAALLRITGPVEVAGWPQPISADNAVAVTLHEAYQQLEQEARIDLLGEVAQATVTAATSGALGSPTALAAALGPAVDRGHLMAYLTRPEEQSFVTDLGLGWELGEVVGDSVLAINQNAGSNKIDWFLERDLRYDVRLTPDGQGAAAVEGVLALALENTAPAGGLDSYIIGPNHQGMVAGMNRSYVSLYSVHGMRAATLDGQPTLLESERELGRSVHSAFIDVPAGAVRTLELEVEGAVPLADGGWYDVEIGRQPLLRADDVTVVITVAPGWHIADSAGGMVVGASGREATFTASLETSQRLGVRLEPLR